MIIRQTYRAFLYLQGAVHTELSKKGAWEVLLDDDGGDDDEDVELDFI